MDRQDVRDLAGLLHAVALLPARGGPVAGRSRAQEHRVRFLRGVLRATARLHLRGFRDAPGDPRRGRGHHGGSHQPPRVAAPATRGGVALLQDRRNRGDARALLRHGMTASDGVLLETERLTRSFGSLVAVNSVSLVIRRGELRSIIGPNGAGKTTFFRLVSGEMAPSSGRVKFRDADITGLPQHRVCRLGIAKSYQITNIFPHLSVLENVRVAVQGYARSFNFWSRADRIAGCRERAVEILETVSLARRAERLAAHLSHREKRQLERRLTPGPPPGL